MRKPVLLLVTFLLGLLLLLQSGQQTLASAPTRVPKSLAIYYAWPSIVNGAATDTATAAAVYGQYDVVIFNAGLEEQGHGDHLRTKEIIRLLHQNYSTRVYGYLDSVNWGKYWSLYDPNPSDWEGHLKMWIDMGADGVFMDRFGYDWGVNRVTQNAIVDLLHSYNMGAFVNSWFVDNAFSSESDPNFPLGNPNRLPTRLGPKDLYLLESFMIIEGKYDVCERQFFDDWYKKATKAMNYRSQFGTEIWAMTTADSLNRPGSNPPDADAKFSYAWYATAMFGLDGLGWSEPQFSASGVSQNQLPWRPRPAPNPPLGIGASFLGDIQRNGNTYTRTTDTGEFQLVCSDSGVHTATFVATCEAARYDFDKNGVVDLDDILAVSNRWMDPALYDPAYDLEPAGQPDGVIDVLDVFAVAVWFGRSCPS